MGRTQIRTIAVDGITYHWNVRPLSPSYVALQVWSASERGQQLRVRFRFDDPWLHIGEHLAGDRDRVAEVLQSQPITPRAVARTIEAAVQRGWSSEHRSLHLAWQDQAFVPVDDATRDVPEVYDDTTGRAQRPPGSDED